MPFGMIFISCLDGYSYIWLYVFGWMDINTYGFMYGMYLTGWI